VFTGVGQAEIGEHVAVLGSSSRASLFGILYLVFRLVEPLPDEFHLGFRRCDPRFGLFLESMDHVDRITDGRQIDCAVGSAAIVGGNLHHAGAERPCGGFALTLISADLVLHASRKRLHELR
jgi:hypothetical protein